MAILAGSSWTRLVKGKSGNFGGRSGGDIMNNTFTQRLDNAKLPKLKMKPFNGNPLEFLSFWDSFHAMVNS